VDIQRQTLKHIRDYRISPLLHPKPADGRPLGPREAALTEYKFIESTHHPEPLQKEVIPELDQVLPLPIRIKLLLIFQSN